MGAPGPTQSHGLFATRGAFLPSFATLGYFAGVTMSSTEYSSVVTIDRILS